MNGLNLRYAIILCPPKFTVSPNTKYSRYCYTHPDMLLVLHKGRFVYFVYFIENLKQIRLDKMHNVYVIGSIKSVTGKLVC